jgi:benzoyl-CoA reductase/2-hydroxyglutaryl-CoA dehydratase subunit BcrC/BadD/HgdB
MSGAVKLIRELEYISQNPRKSILSAMKETGKKAVGCCYAYTPEELVYAAGMLPVGMWGGPPQYPFGQVSPGLLLFLNESRHRTGPAREV